MFKSGELLKEINEYISLFLTVIEKNVYMNNKQGYLNINKECENFFCGLINIIYDLRLINMNNSKMDFPSIDLGDSANRISYQITSDNSIKKINECLKVFDKNKLYEDYDEVVILLLKEKLSYRNKYSYEEFKYSIIDMGDIARKIGRENIDKLEEILGYFKDNFDNSILKKMSEMTIDKSLLVEEQVIGDYPFSYYAFGLGKVRVDGYLPVKASDEISVCFQFAQENISGCSITLSEDEMNKYFFNDYGKKLNDRYFFVGINKKNVIVDFPNNRFSIDIDTANQIIKIVDSLKEKYVDKKKSIIKLIGADEFKCDNRNMYRMIRVHRSIWEMMYQFSIEHDYLGKSKEKWDIFNPQGLNDRIVICRNPEDVSINVDILVSIIMEKVDDEYVDILWNEGYSFSIRENEGFDNKHKWKVDYTHDWIIDEFIPYVLYQRYLFSKSIFKRAMKIEDFKIKYVKDIGIVKSLKRKKS